MKTRFGLFCAIAIAPFTFASQVHANFDGPAFGSIIENKAVYFESSVELQQRMSAGSLTSAELVQDLLQRIEALNNNGPQLNAVIEVNPDALQIAAQMDGERSRGEKRGPLHGIPVLVKDNINTGDKMQTTAGALAMVGSSAPHDAFVVKRLREAGAIIIGKANLSEWAFFRGENPPSGWSGRGGQTLHPYNLSVDPRGSSTGSAVGLAAGFSPLALGTETNGSIIQPAQTNGVVGLRPTLGLLSRTGLIPLTRRQDTPGPMARTVTDTAIMLTAMSGTDPLDDATGQASTYTVNYFDHLSTDALRGKRLGYPRLTWDDKSMDDDPDFQKAKISLQSAGAILVPIDVPDIDNSPEFDVMLQDFKRELNAYLNTRPGLVQQHSLDALVDLSYVSFKGVGAVAGYPGITVPFMRHDDGMPEGLYFLSKAWDEANLLSYAYALEQALVAAPQED